MTNNSLTNTIIEVKNVVESDDISNDDINNLVKILSEWDRTSGSASVMSAIQSNSTNIEDKGNKDSAKLFVNQCKNLHDHLKSLNDQPKLDIYQETIVEFIKKLTNRLVQQCDVLQNKNEQVNTERNQKGETQNIASVSRNKEQCVKVSNNSINQSNKLKKTQNDNELTFVSMKQEGSARNKKKNRSTERKINNLIEDCLFFECKRTGNSRNQKVKNYTNSIDGDCGNKTNTEFQYQPKFQEMYNTSCSVPKTRIGFHPEIIQAGKNKRKPCNKPETCFVIKPTGITLESDMARKSNLPETCVALKTCDRKSDNVVLKTSNETEAYTDYKQDNILNNDNGNGTAEYVGNVSSIEDNSRLMKVVSDMKNTLVGAVLADVENELMIFIKNYCQNNSSSINSLQNCFREILAKTGIQNTHTEGNNTNDKNTRNNQETFIKLVANVDLSNLLEKCEDKREPERSKIDELMEKNRLLEEASCNVDGNLSTEAQVMLSFKELSVILSNVFEEARKKDNSYVALVKSEKATLTECQVSSGVLDEMTTHNLTTMHYKNDDFDSDSDPTIEKISTPLARDDSISAAKPVTITKDKIRPLYGSALIKNTQNTGGPTGDESKIRASSLKKSPSKKMYNSQVHLIESKDIDIFVRNVLKSATNTLNNERQDLRKLKNSESIVEKLKRDSLGAIDGAGVWSAVTVGASLSLGSDILKNHQAPRKKACRHKRNPTKYISIDRLRYMLAERKQPPKSNFAKKEQAVKSPLAQKQRAPKSDLAMREQTPTLGFSFFAKKLYKNLTCRYR